jgi:hypothetical protein
MIISLDPSGYRELLIVSDKDAVPIRVEGQVWVVPCNRWFMASRSVATIFVRYQNGYGDIKSVWDRSVKDPVICMLRDWMVRKDTDIIVSNWQFIHFKAPEPQMDCLIAEMPR